MRDKATLAFEQRLNESLRGSRGVDDVLDLVDRHAEDFDYIHVSTAVNRLQKLALAAAAAARPPPPPSGRSDVNTNVRDVLGKDNRLVLLVKLIRYHHKSFKGQAVANVLHGLAALEADVGVDVRVDDKLAKQLAHVTEREADGAARGRPWSMNAQAVSNTLIALGKFRSVYAATQPSGWTALTRAAERSAPEMNAQAIANTLNSLSKLKPAVNAMTSSGWTSLAMAAAREAETMAPNHVSMTLNALCKMDAAAAEMTTSRWIELAKATETVAPRMVRRMMI